MSMLYSVTCIYSYILTSVQINHEKCLICFRNWNTHIKARTTRITAEIAHVTSGIWLVSDPECLHHSWNSIHTMMYLVFFKAFCIWKHIWCGRWDLEPTSLILNHFHFISHLMKNVMVTLGNQNAYLMDIYFVKKMVKIAKSALCLTPWMCVNYLCI